MNKKLKVLTWLLFIVFLYVVTIRLVIPFVIKVLDSPLILKQTEDDPVGELHTPRTYLGLLHCENQLRADHGLDERTSPSVAEDAYKAWGLGDHTYVIKAKLDVPGPDKKPVLTDVVCKIKYNEGEETNPKSWTLLGVGAEGG